MHLDNSFLSVLVILHKSIDSSLVTFKFLKSGTESISGYAQEKLIKKLIK